MELKWWAVAVAGLMCLLVAVGAAWLLPVARVQRRLRPLAHVDRLTRLPEFARVQRVYTISVMATAVLLVITFVAAVVLAARPVRLAKNVDAYEAAHPRDLMLCVDQPVTEPSTAQFLSYYADQVASFTNEEIGLTSPTLRVLPMTRDRRVGEARLRYFADLAGIRQSIDRGETVSVEQRQRLDTGIRQFSRTLDEEETRPPVEDVLALCLSGFPDFSYAGVRRRQLIYLGDAARGERSPLYDIDELTALAQRAGIQVNAIVRTDTGESHPEANDKLRRLTELTGGRFEVYNPAGTATTDGGAAAVLRDDLNTINDNPPQVVVVGGRTVTARHLDTPAVVLVIAVVAAVLLSVAQAVMRR
ncbi:MAG: hypothetical protein DIU75_013390 [Mycolicibacterium hassiacum]